MINRIARILFIITMYELSKYLANELIIKLQANDEVDTASICDQIDLNEVHK
ncbi:transcriptional activator RinB [Staphylococcus petrasii]|uniref:transcriptional activator RinB n=1 Tax=Staphylococcus petrasii TaxID=1276936 RepID=UPI003F66AC05